MGDPSPTELIQSSHHCRSSSLSSLASPFIRYGDHLGLPPCRCGPGYFHGSAIDRSRSSHGNVTAPWRLLPAPVPSPRNHPRRKRTAFSASSRAAVTRSNPRPGEEFRMGLAGVNHAFELRVGQHAISDKIRWEMWPIGRPGRRNRGHRRRLLRASWDALQRRGCGSPAIRIPRRSHPSAGPLPEEPSPVHRLIDEFVRRRLGKDRSAQRAHRDGQTCLVGQTPWRRQGL